MSLIHKFSSVTSGSIMMQVSLNFFLDVDVLVNCSGKDVDAAKGHLILFDSNDMENFLKVAALLDGSSIDFLFANKRGTEGSTSRIKINTVKKFIRSLDTKGQEEVAKFYTLVYKALVEYNSEKAKSWGCSCCDKDIKRDLLLKLEYGVQSLKSSLGLML